MFLYYYSMLEQLPYIIIGGVLVLTSNPFYFLISLMVNVVVNHTLKNWIRQPRPKECEPFAKKSYGMPSAHTQNASFAAAFVWNEVTRAQQLVLALLVFICMAQRVLSYCHTRMQVLVGLLIGTTLGIISCKIVASLPKLQRIELPIE